jgi:hypothetical protein
MTTLLESDELLIYRQTAGETYKAPISTLRQVSLSTCVVSPTPPINPGQGVLWFDSTKGSLFVYYEDPDTSQWTDSFAGALPSSLVASGGTHERPENPSVGDLYLDTDLNSMLYWDGSAWVLLGGGTGGGANVYTSHQPPPADVSAAGDLWFNTSDGRLYTYLRDVGGSVQWVDASPDSQRFPEWERLDGTVRITEPFHKSDTIRGLNEIHLGEVGTTESSITFKGPNRDVPLIDIHNKVGYSVNGEIPSINIREGNEVNYLVMSDGSTYIGGSIPSAPNISFDADLGQGYFRGVLTAANINLPFDVNDESAGVIDIRGLHTTITNLQSTITDLQTRLATLEGN